MLVSGMDWAVSCMCIRLGHARWEESVQGNGDVMSRMTEGAMSKVWTCNLWGPRTGRKFERPIFFSTVNVYCVVLVSR